MPDKVNMKGIINMAEGYGIVHKSAMQDTNLSCTAKALYALLCSYAGSDGKCYPKVETLVYYLGVTETTFYKHLNILKDKGYISTVQTKLNGKFARTIYTINSVSTPKTEVETKISKTENVSNSIFIEQESCTNKPHTKISCTINQGDIYTNTNSKITSHYKNQSINRIDSDMTENIKTQIDYDWFTDNLPKDEVQFVNVIIGFIAEMRSGSVKLGEFYQSPDSVKILLDAVDCQTILDFREHLRGKPIKNIKNPIAYWRTAFYNFIREQSLNLSTIPDYIL